MNFGIAKIRQHSRKDWGTHAKELLLGYAYTFVYVPHPLFLCALLLIRSSPRTYADGSHEVVSQKVAPVIPKLKPALNPDVQAHFVGGALPPIVDISKFGAPNDREVPKWRPKSDYLIVSSVSPDAACHHGACRLRP